MLTILFSSFVKRFSQCLSQLSVFLSVSEVLLCLTNCFSVYLKICSILMRFGANSHQQQEPWLVDDSVKRCEYKLEQTSEIFNGKESVLQSARVNMAHEQLNRCVVKIVPVYFNGVSEIENCEPINVMASKQHVWLLTLTWYKIGIFWYFRCSLKVKIHTFEAFTAT